MMHQTSARRSKISSRRALRLAAAVGGVALLGGSAHGQVLTWDPNQTPNAPTGGAGTWSISTSNSNWDSSGSDIPWPSTSGTSTYTAEFGAAAGTPTVTLGSNVTVGGLTLLTNACTPPLLSVTWSTFCGA